MVEEEQYKMSASEKKKEDWMNSKWRPMMGWMYMSVCIFDFMLAPILWSVVQSLAHGAVNIQWQPLTLQGAGLFHVAMGAVLGLAAYGRTQEKLAGANNGGLNLQGMGTTYQVPGQMNNGMSGMAGGMGGMNSGGFGGASNGGFGSPSGSSAFGAPSTGGFGASSSFGTPAAGGFGSPSPAAGGFGTPPASGFGAAPSPSPSPVSPPAPLNTPTAPKPIIAAAPPVNALGDPPARNTRNDH